MKCRYKEKQAELAEEADLKETIRIYDDLLTLFMDFLDYYTAITLHTENQFGRKRLNTYFAGSVKMMKDIMDRYEDDNGPDAEYGQNTYWALKMRLDTIGVDMDSLETEYPLYTKFKTQYPKKQAMHERRFRFVKDLDVYVLESMAATMWFLHEEYKFGKQRLERLFESVRRQYLEFAAWYTMVDKQYDNRMTDLLNGCKVKLKEIGVDCLNGEAS